MVLAPSYREIEAAVILIAAWCAVAGTLFSSGCARGERREMDSISSREAPAEPEAHVNLLVAGPVGCRIADLPEPESGSPRTLGDDRGWTPVAPIGFGTCELVVADEFAAQWNCSGADLAVTTARSGGALSAPLAARVPHLYLTPEAAHLAEVDEEARRALCHWAIQSRRSRVLNGDGSGACNWSYFCAALGEPGLERLGDHLADSWSGRAFEWAPPYSPCGIEELVLHASDAHAVAALEVLASCGVRTGRSEQVVAAGLGLVRAGRVEEARRLLAQLKASGSALATDQEVLESAVESPDGVGGQLGEWWERRFP